jgi:hypothetical protein
VASLKLYFFFMDVFDLRILHVSGFFFSKQFFFTGHLFIRAELIFLFFTPSISELKSSLSGKETSRYYLEF